MSNFLGMASHVTPVSAWMVARRRALHASAFGSGWAVLGVWTGAGGCTGDDDEEAGWEIAVASWGNGGMLGWWSVVDGEGDGDGVGGKIGAW